MDLITLRVPSDRRFQPVLRMVVGGIGSRAELAYDQIDELQLAIEAIVGSARPGAAELVIEAEVVDDGMSVLVGPFERAGAGSPVVERLVDRVVGLEREGSVWTRLEVARRQTEQG